MSTYGIDWTNVDLESAYEKSRNLLENYTFETLLLEVYSNIREENLTEEEIKKHAINVFNAKIREAREILNDNLSNITNYAKNERIDI
jgi:hypothetical protein